jgi:hypothetical protein
MTHIRQQIREKVVATLAGMPQTDGRVFKSRNYSLEERELPGICVYTLNETGSPLDMGTAIRRKLDVAIEIYVRNADDADDTIDGICADVEKALAADTTLGDLTKDMLYKSLAVGHTVQGERPVYVARLSYEAEYVAAETDPETPL